MIVKTYKFGTRTVEFDDRDIKDVPPEEMERRVQNMLDVAGRLLYKIQMRQMHEEERG